MTARKPARGAAAAAPAAPRRAPARPRKAATDEAPAGKVAAGKPATGRRPAAKAAAGKAGARKGGTRKGAAAAPAAPQAGVGSAVARSVPVPLPLVDDGYSGLDWDLHHRARCGKIDTAVGAGLVGYGLWVYVIRRSLPTPADPDVPTGTVLQ